ncbi:hypothetical protein ACH5RR_020350 [Cinchona calisaya]|uniref:Uncharacterized protein n=1 Tax=Cinchona calisaya TaxID=153742 RepID=A0ABD2ZE73_9GENT
MAASSFVETVKTTVNENPVVVYPKTCARPQGPHAQKVLERLTGQHTVPNGANILVVVQSQEMLKLLLIHSGWPEEAAVFALATLPVSFGIFSVSGDAKATVDSFWLA